MPLVQRPSQGPAPDVPLGSKDALVLHKRAWSTLDPCVACRSSQEHLPCCNLMAISWIPNQQQHGERHAVIGLLGAEANAEVPLKRKKVRRFANGFQIEEVAMGQPASGRAAKAGERVTVAYTGRLQSTGRLFDKSKGSKGFTFSLGARQGSWHRFSTRQPPCMRAYSPAACELSRSSAEACRAAAGFLR